jgi:hypothetical protein
MTFELCCERKKRPLDQILGSQMATLLAAVLTGCGQIPPAVAIILGLGLAVVYIWLTDIANSLVLIARVTTSSIAKYLESISRAAFRAIAKTTAAADKAAKVRISAMALLALVRRFESIGIIDLNIAPKVIPSPI